MGKKIDVLDVLEVLLAAGIVECRIKVNLPEGFLDKLKSAALDKEIDESELADLIRSYRGK